MNQAEKEVVELFCRELALALRRISGRTIEIDKGLLPIQVDDISDRPIESNNKPPEKQETRS